GPCRGGRLRAIAVAEQDGQVYWQPDDYVRPAIA
ncbi:MAG TPA: Rieske (2Fe-2S) protein, partial [Candidimonas sp.]|nr:Rieske (2Fe-2S) protein [Candidimonas sp.]